VKHPDVHAPAAASAPLSKRALTMAQIALGMGGFGIGTGEFAIMGLLPNVADGLGVTTPEAGHAISAYALGVVVGAPVIAVLAARTSRKTLLLVLMAVFALGNLLSALAPGYLSLLVLRFLTGLPHGAYFGVAALVAASLVPPNRRAQAVGMVMLGLTIATLIGSPLVTWFGQMLSWRVLFASVAVIAVLTIFLIWRYLPATAADDGASPLRELGALKSRQVWFVLAVGAIGGGGMFTVLSYIAPVATDVAHMPAGLVALVMVLFGAGMVAGNTVGAWLADRSMMGTIGGALLFTASALVLFSLTAANPYLLCLFVFLIGCEVAMVPALQTRLMDVAADAQTLAAALNHSAFNIANALGAWLGGLAITWGYGLASTGFVGAGLALSGFVVFLCSLWLDGRPARRARAAAGTAL
jgi:DHA1 family inner membrane transport protein